MKNHGYVTNNCSTYRTCTFYTDLFYCYIEVIVHYKYLGNELKPILWQLKRRIVHKLILCTTPNWVFPALFFTCTQSVLYAFLAGSTRNGRNKMIAAICSSAIWSQTVWSHGYFDSYLRGLRSIYVWGWVEPPIEEKGGFVPAWSLCNTTNLSVTIWKTIKWQTTIRVCRRPFWHLSNKFMSTTTILVHCTCILLNKIGIDEYVRVQYTVLRILDIEY